MKVSKSIWDVRFTRAKPPMALDAAVVDALYALDDWITIRGSHVEIDGDGNVLHGAGGKFAGTNYYRYMNEKARSGNGVFSEPTLEDAKKDSKVVEYANELKEAVTEGVKAATKYVMDDRKQDYEIANNGVKAWKSQAEYDRKKGASEEVIQESLDRARSEQDDADKLRTPKELHRMAREAYELGDVESGMKYDAYAKSAEDEIDAKIKDRVDFEIAVRFDDFEGGLEGDFSKDAQKELIRENVDRVANERLEQMKSEAIYERSDARAKDLLDEMRKNGGIPEGVERYGDEEGNVRDENGQIVENADQVLYGIRTTEQRDAAGQQSIFGGSGWW